MISRFGILLICLSFVSSVWAATPLEDFNTGFRFYGEGNYNSAVEYCKKAVDANPKYWQAYQTMGNAYYKMGKLDDAQTAYQKSLEINPENPGLHQFVDSLKTSAPANAAVESEDPLPQGGSFTWNVGLFGGAASLKDLTAIYGVTITGLTPMITGMEASVDHALFRDIQLGLQLEFMSRAAETLTLVPSGDVKVWSASNLGASLSLKILIPLFPKINLVLRGTGGLYALMDSSVTTTSGGVYG